MTTTLNLDELADERLSARDKGLPARGFGLTVREFLDSDPRIGEFWTPIIALDDEAMRSNLAVMAEWSSARGLELMPHGKTTMAPALWQRQLDIGCTGITLATMGQVRTARSFGLQSIMLANSAVDARSLRYLAAELADPEFRFTCWVDSVATIDAMERALNGVELAQKVNVLVELGQDGGRTGARTIDEATDVARRAAASDVLRLAGVGGYEGSLGHDRSVHSMDAVRRYLERQVELHETLGALYDDGDIMVTAGGSAYFDVVADVYASAMPGDERTHWTLRSGAYITHDDGFYRGISPLDEAGTDVQNPLRSAMRGIARIVSRPEPGLALIDAGKRDFPFDEGLPIPRAHAAELGQPWRPLTGATITAMNDQHSYLALPKGSEAQDAAIGDVIALGLSHPCTAFDKWHYLPVVESAESDRVVDLVRTFF
ncbi:amino acid deaminase [Paramicrobacterium agarici]|uniref:D-serine deaminase-like pyridoxal phosphate-dependent protein n=1 Tax=Paramicrobacterium agarici TaxID=630514 RepID=A0A2A9DVY9_9MICO|nr:amino acid deaminase [Microbacterium agarici]PFG30110.1 D-serine deaminase-like pyridoxal phosphate-dependent protein [Microbacterium agarici]